MEELEDDRILRSNAIFRKTPVKIPPEGQKWIIESHLEVIVDAYPWVLKDKQWFRKLHDKGIELKKFPKTTTLSGVKSVVVRWKNARVTEHLRSRAATMKKKVPVNAD